MKIGKKIQECVYCDEGTNPFTGLDCSICGGTGLQSTSNTKEAIIGDALDEFIQEYRSLEAHGGQLFIFKRQLVDEAAADLAALRRRAELADELAGAMQKQSTEVYYDEDMTPSELWEIIREREAKAAAALAAYRGAK